MRIGFDLDGVLCPTPFGRLAVHAPAPVPELPPDYETYYGKQAAVAPLRLVIEYLRFAWRGGSPEGIAVLTELSGAHEVHIVTGRSVSGEPIVRRWLKRRQLDDVVAGVWMAPPGLRPAQHKLAVALMQGIEAHVDDDPRTAYHLARSGVPRVFLFDHAGAHGDAPPEPSLTIVRSLHEVPQLIAGP